MFDKFFKGNSASQEQVEEIGLDEAIEIVTTSTSGWLSQSIADALIKGERQDLLYDNLAKFHDLDSNTFEKMTVYCFKNSLIQENILNNLKSFRNPDVSSFALHVFRHKFGDMDYVINNGARLGVNFDEVINRCDKEYTILEELKKREGVLRPLVSPAVWAKLEETLRLNDEDWEKSGLDRNRKFNSVDDFG